MRSEVIVDLSYPLSPATPVYPGDPPIAVADVLLNEPVGFNLKRVSTAMHVGTHLDAPRHYFADGAGVDRIPLSACVGRAVMVRVAPVGGIVRTADLESAWNALAIRHERLLVHTGFGDRFGTPAYFSAHPGFEPSLFPFLRKNGIALFAIDLPSIKYGTADNAAAHADLLGAGIVIVETLANTGALPDEFFFAAAPIAFEGFDGSPVRAYAIVG